MDLAFTLTVGIVGLLMALMGFFIWLFERAIKSGSDVGMLFAIFGGFFGSVGMSLSAGIFIYSRLEPLL